MPNNAINQTQNIVNTDGYFNIYKRKLLIIKSKLIRA